MSIPEPLGLIILECVQHLCKMKARSSRKPVCQSCRTADSSTTATKSWPAPPEGWNARKVVQENNRPCSHGAVAEIESLQMKTWTQLAQCVAARSGEDTDTGLNRMLQALSPAHVPISALMPPSALLSSLSNTCIVWAPPSEVGGWNPLQRSPTTPVEGP